MNPTRWRQIDAVYKATLECPADERKGYLDGACGEDVELRREVEALLARDASDDPTLMDGAAVETLSIFVAGMQVGPYIIDGPIGKGGMGEVFRAYDTRLQRKVAIKM